MFKKNNRHLQTALISNVNDLPEKQRMILETSWSGVFFQEFHCRVDELPFAAMYVDFPSRPNAPVNELVSLEFLKAGNDWTDEEMYQHYLFDLQVRHALGLDTLGETHFEMRTVYNFRQRLSQYMQETGINLLDQAFEQSRMSKLWPLDSKQTNNEWIVLKLHRTFVGQVGCNCW